MNKRAEGDTINTIVVMALALIVLAVLLFLTYTYILKPGEQAGASSTCTGQGGHCSASCDATKERGLLGLGCPEKDQAATTVYCCMTKT
jgi:hypothetical protein